MERREALMRSPSRLSLLKYMVHNKLHSKDLCSPNLSSAVWGDSSYEIVRVRTNSLDIIGPECFFCANSTAIPILLH